MQIKVNKKKLKVNNLITLEDLLKILLQHSIGTAISVNHIIIPRTQWTEYILKEGDEVVMFKAIAGG